MSGIPMEADEVNQQKHRILQLRKLKWHADIMCHFYYRYISRYIHCRLSLSYTVKAYFSKIKLESENSPLHTYNLAEYFDSMWNKRADNANQLWSCHSVCNTKLSSMCIFQPTNDPYNNYLTVRVITVMFMTLKGYFCDAFFFFKLEAIYEKEI